MLQLSEWWCTSTVHLSRTGYGASFTSKPDKDPASKSQTVRLALSPLGMDPLVKEGNKLLCIWREKSKISSMQTQQHKVVNLIPTSLQVQKVMWESQKPIEKYIETSMKSILSDFSLQNVTSAISAYKNKTKCEKKSSNAVRLLTVPLIVKSHK